MSEPSRIHGDERSWANLGMGAWSISKWNPNQRKPSTRDTNKSNTSVLMSFFLIGLDDTSATIRAGWA
jgi:hypothetical protein